MSDFAVQQSSEIGHTDGHMDNPGFHSDPMNRIGPRASKSRGSDSEYVHAYHDYNVTDRYPGTSQIHLLTYLLIQTEVYGVSSKDFSW